MLNDRRPDREGWAAGPSAYGASAWRRCFYLKKATADPMNVPFVTALMTMRWYLPCGTPHTGPLVYLSETVPASVAGE